MLKGLFVGIAIGVLLVVAFWGVKVRSRFGAWGCLAYMLLMGLLLFGALQALEEALEAWIRGG